MIAAAGAKAPAGMRVRVLFEDEGRFGRISDLRRCWAPLPSRPEVSAQVIRQYVYAFMAVCPADGRIASLILPWSDAATMSIFLRHTAAQFPGEFCIVILDGAGWHLAHDLAVPDTIGLIFLPPYSPELNPVEHIWEHIRENHFRNQAMPDLDAVEDHLMQAIGALITSPELVTSMTLFSWLKTLPMT